MTSTFSIADLMTCTNSARQAGRYILILLVLCGAIAAAQPVVSVVPPVQLDLGIGVEFTAPGVGSFDTSVKYQMLNLWGKDATDNDKTVAQIAANLTIVFSVL